MDNKERVTARDEKTKRDQFRWKKNIKNKHQGENELQRKESEQEHIKRATRQFLEVSRCSRAKQRQRNVQMCATRAKLYLVFVSN